MDKGKFIVFEGIDCCGKTTQITKLIEWLNENKINFFATRDPGGTPVAEEIRTKLSDGTYKTQIERFFAYQQARTSLAPVIKEKLESGKHVICDRWTYSTVAYQQYGFGIDAELVELANKESSMGLVPDLCFIIDISVEEAINRLRYKDKDFLDVTDTTAMNRIRKGYLDFLMDDYMEAISLNGKCSILQIHSAVIYNLEPILLPNKIEIADSWSISGLVKEAHANAKLKGFWDEPRNDAECIMLMVTELAEAVEGLRKGDTDNVAEELADTVIRIADYAGGRNIDLEWAIRNKMKVNESRPQKHDKEF